MKCYAKSPKMKNWRVADAGNSEGEWRWDGLNVVISSEARLRINSVLPPSRDNRDDRFRWKRGVQGDYNVKSGYSLLLKGSWGQKDAIWKLEWDWPGIERIRTFLLTHEKIHTNALRHRRWGASPYCVVCRQPETAMHVMRDCKVARSVWQRLILGEKKRNFFQLNLKEWLYDNLKQEPEEHNKVSWRVVFGVACWFLWKERNKKVFKVEGREREASELVWGIVDFSSNMTEAMNEPMVHEFSSPIKGMISWKAPPVGWVKLNSDGASKGDERLAGCGGVVRDNEGRWLLGYSRYIGYGHALEAEMWGVLLGLELCWNARYAKLTLN